MIIKKTCKFCNKTSEVTSEIDLGSSKIIIFKCGHSYTENMIGISKVSEASQEEQETLLQQLENAIPEYCEEHERKCIKVLQSKTGKHLFPYQRDGIVKAAKNNAKFIFADEMGLGKTVQGLGTLLMDKENLLPAIFVCKSIAKTNWLRETLDWMQLPAQIIEKSSHTPFDMFKIHIISYDMINRLDKIFHFSDIKDETVCPKCQNKYDADKNAVGSKCPNCSSIKQIEGPRTQEIESIEEGGKLITRIKVNTEFMREQELEVPKLELWVDKSLYSPNASVRDQNKVAWVNIIKRCKTIILDEVHLIKSQTAQRTRAVKNLCKLIPHCMPMSGTVIKNNATEYFTPLNIVRPEKFWRYENFCRANVRFEFVRTAIGYSQKYTGLINPSEFMEDCASFIIRRTVDDVLPELPKLQKQQKYVEIDENFRELYDESESDFAKWFDSATKQELSVDLLGRLAQLRHQTSLAKVDFTIDLALEFILSCDRKLAIFTHHIDSREFLAERLINFFKTTDQGDIVTILTQGRDVQEQIDEFKNGDKRIIILSTLSHGESINLQFMSDSILHERQWNPANEDQSISGRFRRIGQESKHLNCMIPIAIGTIDEYFVEINARKGAIGKEIDTGMIEEWNGGFVAELAELIASKGREKWKL